MKKFTSAFFVLLLCLAYCSNLFAQSFNGFDLSNSLIDTQHIVQGGPPRDGIPSIDDPKYVSVEQSDFMQPKDVVLGIVIDGQAFAYPRHIMNWHEVVNDSYNGNAFMISYCPLCGTGLAFSAVVDEKLLTFGVSGLLYNNDLIFYDRETESLWSQIERRAIAGSFAGKVLQQLYMEHTSWQDWQTRYPKTKILSNDQGFKRNYRHDPYTGYETSSLVFFQTLRQAPKDFHSKEKVLGIVIGNKAKAYPFSELQKQNKASFEDQLGEHKYTVIWNEEAYSARIKNESEQVLTPTVAYWFAWYNFHPETAVFRAK